MESNYIFGKHTFKKQVVHYSYQYKDQTIFYRFKFPYKEGEPNTYYTKLVDEEIAKLKASGELDKYSEEYLKKMAWRKKYGKPVTIAAIAGGVVVVGLTIGLTVGLLNRGTLDNVIFESETLEIDRTNVTLHRDANFTFTVNEFYASYGYYLPDKVDQVSINGTTLTADQYTYSNGQLKIKGEFVTGTVYIAAEANYVHFEDDSWDNIIKYANMGLDDLYIRYGRKSVVGSQHDMQTKGGANLKVKVIGEGHDRIVKNGEPTNKAAALTFQLSIIVGENNYYDSDANAGYYANSDLKQFCDDIIFDGILSDQIKAQIKEVDKYTSTSEIGYEHSTEKVFPLSLREINGEDPYIDGSKYNYYYSHEESPYEYYLEKDEAKLNERRVLLSAGQPVGYWLRSLYVDEGPTYSANMVTPKGQTVVGNGHEFNNNFVLNPQGQTLPGLVVAFSIGETDSFITDSWENVATVANSGLENLKAYYGMESFVGLERDIKLDNVDQTIKVRVIGQNHDQLADSEDHVAALTFEACYTDQTKAFGSDHASYANSIIRSEINDNFYINQLPLEIKRGIPLVKKVNAGTRPDGEELYITTMEETEDHVFILSLREYGDVWFSLAEPYSLEEKAYDYYRMPINSIEDMVKLNHLRIKGANDYWTRSANPLYRDMETTVTGANGQVMEIHEGQYLLNKTLISDDDSCGYAPAFGFGVSNKPVTFETDSWENVCYYALQGLDVLKSHYDLRSFIGATRKVTLFIGTEQEATYSVRVIGENQDIDVNGNKAPLTFEFTTTLAQRNITGDPFEGEYYLKDAIDGNIPVWSTSDLRGFCSNEILPLMPEALRNSIRSVVKNTVVYYSESDKAIETTTEKLFPLSRNEISNSYSDKPDKPDPDCVLYRQENETYQYYIDAPEYLLQKQDGASLVGYWLRSPTLQQSPTANLYRAWGVTDAGWLQDNAKITERRGVAPAFAI